MSHSRGRSFSNDGFAPDLFAKNISNLLHLVAIAISPVIYIDVAAIKPRPLTTLLSSIYKLLEIHLGYTNSTVSGQVTRLGVKKKPYR